MTNQPKNMQFDATPKEIDYILSTRSIRERAQKIFSLVENGQSYFKINSEALLPTSQFVAKVCKENYPKLDMPFHSRWRHFNVGGVDRLAHLNKLAPAEKVKARFDLAVVSVLLDAGAGSKWKYVEDGKSYSKSEGLALATLKMFNEGRFSRDAKSPYRVDGEKLCEFSDLPLASGFQINTENQLEGFVGRVQLLKALGQTLIKQKEYFGGTEARPSGLIPYLKGKEKNGLLPAAEILTALQKSLAPIWPGRVKIGDFNVGDVWPHSKLGEGIAGLVPFHKLSQWLAYSLVDPLVESGMKVSSFDELTCLAEYRNGGLLIDTNFLELRDKTLLKETHSVSSDLIIEWRALTVHLMEHVANSVRTILGRNKLELPLGKILEGGTWAAGRKIALEKRSDGSPPLRIISDGTVF